MRYAALSSVVCLAVQYFPTLSHKRHDFREKVTGHTMCVLTFFTTFIGNVSDSKKKWARYDKKLYWSSCKVPFILVRLQWNLKFLVRFARNLQVSNFIKFRPMGAELFHAAGQTGRHDEATSRFPNFANALRIWYTWQFKHAHRHGKNIRITDEVW